jgi:ABC-type branched-subunit amino acid transport system substrate-binding protein
VTGARRALIVATGAYGDEKFRQLRAPAADAERLAEVLGDPAIGEFVVDVALDEDESALRRRIARFFAQSNRDDVLLLHLSGHGVKDARGDLFLAARDTEIDLLEATALAASWLDEQITRSPSRRVLLLLDCCFSGRFPFNATARAGDSVDVPQRFQGRGRAVITATNATEYAYEGDRLSGDGHRSYFTDALIQGLKTGEADRDQDQWISVDELYDYIVDRVVPTQTPTKKIALEGAPLYVAHSNFIRPAVLDSNIIALTEHPMSTVRLGAITDHLEPLMNNTANAGMALAARQRLEQMVDDDSRRVAGHASKVLHERAQQEEAERAAEAEAERAAEAEADRVRQAEAEHVRQAEAERARQARAEHARLEQAAAGRKGVIGHIPAGGPGGPPATGPPPRQAAATRWRPSRQLRYTAAGAIAAAIVVAAAINAISGGAHDASLRIYSSLPQTEPPTSAAANAHGHPFQRILDMEKAMRLALDQNHGKAGRFDVDYMPLDDSDADGEPQIALAQANAQRAANDPSTAVYIGDFNSGPTQGAMPILSHAKIPQISPAATRVGLTQKDDLGDGDEPERYRKGSRNFVRIIPTATALAKALLARMRRDACKKAVMINDSTPYGTDLATRIRFFNHRRIHFAFSQSVAARGSYSVLLAQARRQKPDCFVYSGTRNANTLNIFSDFADTLVKPAKLYGTNGVADDTFTRLLPSRIAKQVTVMLPWHDPAHSAGFVEAFKKVAHGRNPDTYAYYAYEAMRLALDAIKRSKTGKPKDVLTTLRNIRRPNSPLGSYSFTPAGDITPARPGFSTISAARRREAPELAPCPGC